MSEIKIEININEHCANMISVLAYHGLKTSVDSFIETIREAVIVEVKKGQHNDN